MSALRARFLALAAASSHDNDRARRGAASRAGVTSQRPAATPSPQAGALSHIGTDGVAGRHGRGRRGSKSAASVPPQLLDGSGDPAIMDVLTRSSALLRMSAHSRMASAGAHGGRAGAQGRIRMEALGTRLIALETLFDMQAYGLGVSNGQRRPGGVAIVFDFYSRLFAAQKQLGTKLTHVTTELAERADGTMSYGELTFLLKDFKVLPQLISRTELLYILSQRTLGKQLRRRREQYDLSLSLLMQEEEALDRDHKAAQVVPAKFTTSHNAPPPAGVSPLPVDRRIHTLDPVQMRPGEGNKSEILARVERRRERVRQLRNAVARFEASMLDPATLIEARMEHGSYELSFTEFLEVLVRIALFAFSKPSLAASDVGVPSAAPRNPASTAATLSASQATSNMPVTAALHASNASSVANLALTSPAPASTPALESAFAGLVRSVAAKRAIDGYNDISETAEYKIMRLVRYMALDQPATARRIVLTIGAATQQYLNATPGMTDPTRKAFAGRKATDAPPVRGVQPSLTAQLQAAASAEAATASSELQGTSPAAGAAEAETVQTLIDAAVALSDSAHGSRTGAQAGLPRKASVSGFSPDPAAPGAAAPMGRRMSMKQMLMDPSAEILAPKRPKVSELTQSDESAVSETHAALEHHHHARVGQWVRDSSGQWISTHYTMVVGKAADSPREHGGNSATDALRPELAVTRQYSNSLCDLVRRFEYDTLSPVFQSFGGMFIDCGTLTFAHRNAAMTVDAPDAQQQLFRYRVVITNECTDVLSLSLQPHGLSKDIFSMHVVESRSGVTLTDAARQAAKEQEAAAQKALAAASQRNALAAASAAARSTFSLRTSTSLPSLAGSRPPRLLASGSIGAPSGEPARAASRAGEDEFDDALHSAAHVSRVVSHVSSMALASAAAAAGLHGSSASVTALSRWKKTGLKASVDADTGTVHARDLAPGLSLVVEIVVKPPAVADDVEDMDIGAEMVLSGRGDATNRGETADASGNPSEVLGQLDVLATSVLGELQVVHIPVYAKFETGLDRAVAPHLDEDGAVVAEPPRTSSDADAAAHVGIALEGVAPLVTAQRSVRSVGTPSVSGSPVARMRAPVIKRGDSFQDLSSGSRRHSGVARDIAADAHVAAIAAGTVFDATVRARLDSYTSEFTMRRTPSFGGTEFDFEASVPLSPGSRRSPAAHAVDTGEGSAIQRSATRLGAPRRENLRVHAVQFTAGVAELERYLSTALDARGPPPDFGDDWHDSAVLNAMSSSGTTHLAALPAAAARHAAAVVPVPRSQNAVKHFRLPMTTAALGQR